MTAYFSEKSGTNKTLTASRKTSPRSKSGRTNGKCLFIRRSELSSEYPPTEEK
ncbi:hypothetical protein DPMN_022726 [Dreissena polymorpha]|uniref:Uncharacterized protein n=1 Tax=Dreissena polymorpha TaxID=45954 RepID=A0A9D4NPD0_DREPO|nr:hypothetical protein DPMN_022726 [Dreissena polymorpha]